MRGVPSDAFANVSPIRLGSEDRRRAAAPRNNVEGTPTFIVNGTKAEDAHDFATLQPILQQALGS